MMNIKQGYLDIYKELAMFLEVHMVNKKMKKTVIEITNNKVANEKINKTLNDKSFKNEETGLSTYDEITRIDNNFKNINQTNASLINFSHAKLLNVINESESILNEIKHIIVNKSKKKQQQKDNIFDSNPYGLLKLSHKKDKTNSLSTTHLFANANISYDQESTFNIDLKYEFSSNNLSHFHNKSKNLNHNQNNNFAVNKDSDNKFKRNSYNKNLIEEDSKEYEDDEESEQKPKDNRTLEIDDNLSENLFSCAVNFGGFNEFPVINYDKNLEKNNNYNTKKSMNAIEENDFEENYNNDEINQITQDRQIRNTPVATTEEKEKLNEQVFNANRNSLSNNQKFNFTQTQNMRNSLISNSGLNENPKNDFLFALKSLEKKLSKDDFIQQELNALNQKHLNVGKKKKLKGVKFDKDIHIDFYKLMKSFLSKDLKDSVDMENFSYQELVRRKVLNENRKLLKRCHEVILLENQLDKINRTINKEKDPNKKESYLFDKPFNLFDNIRNLSKRGKSSRSNTKSKRTVIQKDDLHNEDLNKPLNKKSSLIIEEKVCEIKNKSIPLTDKLEKLFILNDFSKLKEYEKQINNSLLNKTKENIPNDLNNMLHSQSVNNENASMNKSNNNSKTSTNTELGNLSSKYDHLRRNSVLRNKNSILNTNGEKSDDFGTPNEVFEKNDLSQKNLNNLKNFNINKYLNPLNDIITEEDSNFNNNFFTNLESNFINENKNYKNNLNFEDLPEENENVNEDEEEIENNNYLYNEENAQIINNLKYDFIKNAIFQYLKMTKDRSLYYNNKASENDVRGGSLTINLVKINKIFYENTENSELGYMEKEIILKNKEDNIGNVFYALLLESQKENIEIYQYDLFGDIFFDN